MADDAVAPAAIDKPLLTPLSKSLENVADMAARLDEMAGLTGAIQKTPFKDCVGELFRGFSKLQLEIIKMQDAYLDTVNKYKKVAVKPEQYSTVLKKIIS